VGSIVVKTAAGAEDPVRVLSVFIDFRPVYTGEGEWWLRMAPLLRARGVTAEVLTRAPEGGAPAHEVVDGTAVRRLSLPPGVGGRAWISAVLRTLVQRRRQFDVVQFHGTNDDAVHASCLAGRLLGWKTVFRMTLTGDDDLATIRSTGRFGWGRLAALRLAHGYVAMAAALTRGFEDAGFLADRLLIVPQGVDTAIFKPASADERSAARCQLEISESARVALFCGAIVPRKGVDVLVEAWTKVRARIPGAILLLVGPDHHGDALVNPEHRAFSARLEQRIQDLGLAGSIRMAGFQHDVRRFYAAANLFVLPSHAEGQPAVVGEALASGLPCVLSQLEGITEDDLKHGQEGFIVPTFAPDDYADPLVRLLGDAEASAAMGRRARARAVARFDLGRIADSYAAFLRMVARRSEHRTALRRVSPAESSS
jgi:glycosyltransferase involved in cell wall biosynthesis